jgi:hypothetical protein
MRTMIEHAPAEKKSSRRCPVLIRLFSLTVPVEIMVAVQNVVIMAVHRMYSACPCEGKPSGVLRGRHLRILSACNWISLVKSRSRK